jgi:hypothetical protein
LVDGGYQSKCGKSLNNIGNIINLAAGEDEYRQAHKRVDNPHGAEYEIDNSAPSIITFGFLSFQKR